MNEKKIIEDLFATIDAGAFDQLDRYFSPSAVYERPGYVPYVGYGEILNFYQHIRAIDNGEHRLENMVYDGKVMMSSGSFTGVKKDGDEVEIKFSECYRFKDSKIVHRRTYFFQPAV